MQHASAARQMTGSVVRRTRTPLKPTVRQLHPSPNIREDVYLHELQPQRQGLRDVCHAARKRRKADGEVSGKENRDTSQADGMMPRIQAQSLTRGLRAVCAAARKRRKADGNASGKENKNMSQADSVPAASQPQSPTAQPPSPAAAPAPLSVRFASSARSIMPKLSTVHKYWAHWDHVHMGQLY